MHHGSCPPNHPSPPRFPDRLDFLMRGGKENGRDPVVRFSFQFTVFRAKEAVLEFRILRSPLLDRSCFDLSFPGLNRYCQILWLTLPALFKLRRSAR